MANSKDLFRELVSKITIDENQDEIESIVFLLLDHETGLNRTDILVGKETNYNVQQFDAMVERVNRQEPIQYVLGETEFFGRKFKVNSSVLIPRPETEIIIREILQKESNIHPLRILDIGTGSGCLAVALACELPNATVFATDISTGAIETAKANALLNRCHVHFVHHNILNDEIPFGDLDIIVSNPPYVLRKEMSLMKKNVTGFEPHLALFVPDDDPMVFYQSIAEKSKKALTSSGSVLVEINEKFGDEVGRVFLDVGFHSTQIIKDIDSKDRVIKSSLRS